MPTTLRASRFGLGLVCAAGILGAAAWASDAHATPTKCSDSSPFTENADGLSVDDATFGVGSDTPQSADDCYGLFGVAPDDELATVNDDSIWGDPDFIFLSKFETPDNDNPGTTEDGDLLAGVKFTITASNTNGNEWDFTVEWTPEKDITVDFVFLIKGASGSESNAMYLFESLDLMGETSGMGTLIVKVKTPNSGNLADLSHVSLFGRSTFGNGGFEIPMPATLWLFGAGLVGLGLAQRRRRTLHPDDAVN